MFFKKISFFLIVLFLLVFCNKPKDNNDFLIKIPSNLLAKAQRTTEDSLPYYFLKLDKLDISSLPDSLKATLSFLRAEFLYQRKNTKEAFEFYNKSIQFFKDTISNADVHKYYIVTANRYAEEGNYLNSLGVLENYELLIKKNDYSNLALLYDLMKRNYSLLQNYNKASTYNKMAIHNYALKGDTTNVINNLIYQSELNFYNLKNKKKAYHLLDSIGNLKSWNNFYLKYYYYNNYGIFNLLDGNYKLAYKNYLHALYYIKKSSYEEDLSSLGDCYANIAEVFMKLENFNLSKKYIDSVSAYANYLNSNQTKFYLQTKFQLSFLTDKKFDGIAKNIDSLFVFMNKTYEKRIETELNALKEANKKERELLLENKNSKINNLNLKRKQLVLFTVLTVVLLGLLLSISLYKQHKFKTAKNEIFMQQRLFRSQMNPHFTSNVLYTIKRLITKDTKLANKYLVKFSKLLRLTLENSTKNYVSIEKELDVLTKYLDLQQLRFEDSFIYTIDTNKIDLSLIHIPPMLIQPFVENAVIHGFKSIAYKGKLDIRLLQKENVVYCEIEDNGVGINSDISKDKHNSVSTTLIKNLLIKLTGENVKSISKKQGTIIQFEIPYKIK